MKLYASAYNLDPTLMKHYHATSIIIYQIYYVCKGAVRGHVSNVYDDDDKSLQWLLRCGLAMSV